MEHKQLGILDTQVALYSSTLLNVSFFFFKIIEASKFSFLFLVEVIDTWDSSKLSTFYSSVYFPLLTLLSLVSLPVFSNSGPIKMGDIYSSLLTPESDQVSNSAVKIQSAAWRRSSTLYQKLHSLSTSYHARIYWLLYRIKLSHLSTGRFKLL